MDERQIAALILNAILNLSVTKSDFNVSPKDASLIAEEAAKYIKQRLG